MWGPSLLVNPVTSKGVTSRPVYLPQGFIWYDLYNGTSYKGGQSINASANYERIPVFVKGGSILPIGDDLQYTTEKKQDKLTLLIYDGADGNFVLYEDAGVNYDYEKGNCATIDLKYIAKSGQLIIGDRKGEFPGMLHDRTFNVVLIDAKQPSGIDKKSDGGRIVKYNGKSLKLKLK